MPQQSRSNANRPIAIILLIISTCCSTYAQISGRVVDMQGNPIDGAYIYYKTASNIGTISNAEGNFTLPAVPANDSLVAQFIGFETQTVAISKSPITIVLQEKSETITDVLIVRERSVSREFSVKQLSPLDIYLTPLSSGDPLRAVAALPSSTNTSESANVELRGSSGDFSRVVLNDVPIYNPIRNMQLSGLGNFSLLNTDIISEQLVYAGNPPLKYGNSTAGLVEVRTIDSLTDSQMLKLSLSMASLGAFYAQGNRRSFIQAYGNYQTSWLYLPANKKSLDFINNFSSIDGGFNFRYYINKSLYINVYSYAIAENYNANSYMYNYRGAMDYTNKRNFNIINFVYHRRILQFTLNHGTNIERNNLIFGNLDILQNTRNHYTSLDTKISIGNMLQLQAGMAHDYGHSNFDCTFPWFIFAVNPNDSSYSFSTSDNNHMLEAYAYGKLNIHRFHIGLGARKNIPIQGQPNTISTQLSGKFNINSHHSILITGGLYHGYTYPNHTIMSYKPVASKQASIEYLLHKPQHSLNIAAYHKTEDMPIYYNTHSQQLDTRISINGIEIGGEAILNNNFSLTGSYTYLHSYSKNDIETFETSNSLNYLIKCGLSYWNNRIINASMNIATRHGLRYTPIIGSEYSTSANSLRPTYGPTNSARLGNYTCIDLMLNRIFSLKSTSIIAFLNITNILNTNNTAGWMYNTDYSEATAWLYQKRTIYLGTTFSLK